MPKEKNYFLFNYEWAEVLSEYSAEVRLEVYDAIIRYAQSGTLSELKPQAKMAFSFIKKEIDRNETKYEESVSNGKKGGNPNFRKGERNIYYGKKITQDNPTLGEITQDNPTLPPDNLNDSDYVYDNVSEDKSSSTPHTPQGGSAAVDVAEARKKIISGFFAKQKSLESFCMKNRITPDKLRGLAEEVFDEWELVNEKDITERHLLNTIRVKLNFEKNADSRKHTQTAWSGRDGVQYKGAVDYDCGLIED
ncbi:MAG: DUF6291 domain-containing protein [Candidatus Amulumruptor caecigallinarius]|nr:DUF6291 domain-containing protein [Candidatus Amulumruptor caecigallinarius]